MSTETIALTIAFASVIAVGALAVYVIRMRSSEATVASTEIVTSLNDFTTKFATDQGVLFLDVTAGDASMYQTDEPFSDFHHMTPEGAAELTRLLAEAMLESGAGLLGEAVGG